MKIACSLACFAWAAAAQLGHAETLPLQSWILTGVSPGEETGVIFVTADPGQGGNAWVIFNDIGLSQTRNLAAGQYAITYTSSGTNVASPPAESEHAVASISGAGSGTVLTDTRTDVVDLLANPNLADHTDTFQVGSGGSKIISLQFYGGSACPTAAGASVCGIWFLPDAVELTLLALDQLAPQLPASTPRNLRNVVAAIDPFTADPASLPSGFLALYTADPADLQGNLAELAGEVGASGGMLAASLLTDEFLLLMQHSGSDPADRLMTPDEPWRFWLAAYGGTAAYSGDATAGSSDTSTQGMGQAFGANGSLGGSTVGFALSSAATQWQLGKDGGRGTSVGFKAGGHATLNAGEFYASVLGSYSLSELQTHRAVRFSGDAFEGATEQQDIAARLEIGRSLPLTDAVSVSPFAAAQGELIGTGGYSESATAGSDQFALAYAPQMDRLVRSEVGLSAALGNGPIEVSARAAWAHDWISPGSAEAGFTALPGSSFGISGAPLPADFAIVQVAGTYSVSPATALSANLDGKFAPRSSSFGGKLSLHTSW